MLKTSGYLISSLSVILLALVSWQATRDDQTLRLCLIAGAAASIVGMLCRWLSYRQDEKPG